MKEIIAKSIEKVEREKYGYNEMEKPDFTEEEMNRKIEEFSDNHKRKKSIVKEVLEGWELCRNNDRILDIECLRTEFQDIQITSGKDNVIVRIPRKLMLHLPSPEVYTRSRRSLILSAIRKNNHELIKNLIPTNPRVLEKRMKKEKVLREYFRRQRL